MFAERSNGDVRGEEEEEEEGAPRGRRGSAPGKGFSVGYTDFDPGNLFSILCDSSF